MMLIREDAGAFDPKRIQIARWPRPAEKWSATPFRPTIEKKIRFKISATGGGHQHP